MVIRPLEVPDVAQVSGKWSDPVVGGQGHDTCERPTDVVDLGQKWPIADPF